jgi:hypothetical protein
VVVRRGAAVALALATLTLAGCADSETQPAPKDISGPPQGVARTVERLDRAVRARDFESVCDDLLTPAARRRAGGDRCAARLAANARGVRQSRIRLLAIRIVGRRAEARIRTRSQGRAPVEETLRLERDGRGYRISALSR